MPVWVACGELAGLFIGEGLVALIGLAVDLDVVERAVGLDPFVGVARVAVHVTVGVWGATVTEEVHELVNRFLVSREVVPEHGGILQVGLGVALLGVDEDGEFGGIPDEENRGVVEDPVPVALLRVELEGESTGVSSTVRRTLLTTNSRETREHLGLLANSLEHVDDSLSKHTSNVSVESTYRGGIFWKGRSYEIANVVRHLEFTISTSTLGVDDTFWDPLAVKVCQQIDQMEVLKEKRSIWANPLGGLRVHDRTAIGGGVDGGLIVAVGS